MAMLVLLRHGNHAPMRHFANHVLKLNGRMADAEVMKQPFFYVAQDALAHRGGYIRNRNVARKRMGL